MNKENNFEKFNLKEHWQGFLNGKIVVNCNTEELAKEFLKYCHEQGLKWAGEDNLIDSDSQWDEYKSNTCYGCENSHITYSDIKYYLEEHYKIVEFKEIEFTPNIILNECSEMQKQIQDFENQFDNQKIIVDDSLGIIKSFDYMNKTIDVYFEENNTMILFKITSDGLVKIRRVVNNEI